MKCGNFIKTKWSPRDTINNLTLIQRKMSKHMISDQNTINDINPFVLIDFSLPGSAGKPYQFSKYQKPIETVEKEEPSVACRLHRKVGGANFCEDPQANCPMSRLVLPERVIQYEDGSVNTDLCADNGSIAKKEQEEKDRRRFINRLLLVLLFIVLVYLLIL